MATSTDFVHWTTPVDALPVLPAWAHPGFTWAPDLHRFGDLYALYFTAMVAGYSPQTECIGSAFSGLPHRALHRPGGTRSSASSTRAARSTPGSSSTPTAPRGCCGSPTRTSGGPTRRPRCGRSDCPPTGPGLLGSPTLLMSPDEAWQGTIVEAPDMVEVDGAYWVVYSANWYNQPAVRHRGGPLRRPGRTVRRPQSASPLLASNLQGAGPGRGLGLPRRDRDLDALQPVALAGPEARHPGAARLHHPARLRPSGPYLAERPAAWDGDLLGRPLWAPTP